MFPFEHFGLFLCKTPTFLNYEHIIEVGNYSKICWNICTKFIYWGKKIIYVTTVVTQNQEFVRSNVIYIYIYVYVWWSQKPVDFVEIVV